MVRNFVSSNAIPEPYFDVLGVEAMVALWRALNIRSDSLSPASVRDPDDCDRGNVWMFLEGFFNIGWGDVFSCYINTQALLAVFGLYQGLGGTLLTLLDHVFCSSDNHTCTRAVQRDNIPRT